MLQTNLRSRGYTVLYHSGEKTRCPGCGHCNWEIGRTMAECSFCATALPLAEVGVTEAMPTLVQARSTGLHENAWQTPLLLQSTIAALVAGGFIVNMAI